MNRRAFVCALGLAAFSLLLLGWSHALYAFTLHPEGYRAYSPIMMLQGAPVSHYETEHALSYGLFRATSTPLGMAAGAGLLILLFLGRAKVLHRRGGPATDFLLSWALLELMLLLLTSQLAPATAFHHAGWGIPCGSSWTGDFLWLNILALPFHYLLVNRLLDERDRRRGSGFPWDPRMSANRPDVPPA